MKNFTRMLMILAVVAAAIVVPMLASNGSAGGQRPVYTAQQGQQDLDGFRQQLKEQGDDFDALYAGAWLDGSNHPYVAVTSISPAIQKVAANYHVRLKQVQYSLAGLTAAAQAMADVPGVTAIISEKDNAVFITCPRGTDLAALTAGLDAGMLKIIYKD